MLSRLFIPVFSLTLLLSAALLFSVQPMFSKMALPLLGGTPQVWNTAMLFFQVCLLGGYAYAHLTSRWIKPGLQACLHCILLVIFTVVLPFAIPADWVPPINENPTLWQLGVMAATVGGPFFVLAGSAPMLQKWYAGTTAKDADNPYFLYGASNLGSMGALLAYPFVIEPLATLPEQASLWQYSYFFLILCVGACGILATKGRKNTQPHSHHIDRTASTRLTKGQIVYWLILAFLPSSLMLGVTTYLTTDIASVPLLWILPLSIYIGTFVLVFARKPIFSTNLSTTLFEIGLIAFCMYMIFASAQMMSPLIVMALHLCVFFCAALFCHTALATSRPSPEHLTAFYLTMSAGGALGGILNAIVAPQLFIVPLEYPLILVLAACARYAHLRETSLRLSLKHFGTALSSSGLNAVLIRPYFALFCAVVALIFALGIGQKYVIFAAGAAIVVCLVLTINHRWIFALIVALICCVYPPGYHWGRSDVTQILHQSRNFYGVLRVFDSSSGERVLQHGTTNHGTQALSAELRLQPTSYYGGDSPIRDVIDILDRRPAGAQRMAVLGLGAGVSACYTRPQRHFDYFEIDPAVIEVAQNPDLFTYLRDCGSSYEIIPGDARLRLATMPDLHYDMVHADAFSSDNIPVHLITKEAVEMYLSKLKPDGVLLLHISNNYLDLEPVLGAIAKELEMPALAKISLGGKIPGTDLEYNPSHCLVMTRSPSALKQLQKMGWSTPLEREGVKGWSDQYSNLFGVLGNRSGEQRFKELKQQQKTKITRTKIKMTIKPSPDMRE
jgi:hypothetical protein